MKVLLSILLFALGAVAPLPTTTVDPVTGEVFDLTPTNLLTTTDAIIEAWEFDDAPIVTTNCLTVMGSTPLIRACLTSRDRPAFTAIEFAADDAGNVDAITAIDVDLLSPACRTNLVRQLAERGDVCGVYGHWWGEPVLLWDAERYGPSEGGRLCRLCAKVQTYKPGVWE